MAEFEKAMRYTFPFEGGISDHPADRGGYTRFGITSFTAARHRCAEHPRGIAITEVTERLAEHIYRLDFWEPLEEVKSQRIASDIFDHGVNMGPNVARMLAQRAMVAAGYPVTVDGIIGPQSLSVLNAFETCAEEDAYLEEFSKAIGDYYVDIIRNDLAAYLSKRLRISKRSAWEIINNELQAAFAKGWIRRAIDRPPMEIPAHGCAAYQAQMAGAEEEGKK